MSVNSNEQTPLLPRIRPAEAEVVAPELLCNPSLWIIVLVFTFGSIIGGYLLYMQDQEFPVSKPFFLVHRIKWGAVPRRPTGPEIRSTPVPLVIVAQVGSRSCKDISSCSQIVRDIQACDKARDVPFNFLVGADGNTYEGQGWRNQSLFSLPEIETSSALVLAFIGDFTASSPSRDQLDEAQVWIAESIALNVLSDQYVLVGLRNLSRSSNDGKSLFEQVAQWPNYNATIGARM